VTRPSETEIQEASTLLSKAFLQSEDDLERRILDLDGDVLAIVRDDRDCRRLDPGVKVVLSSGYSGDEATKQFAGDDLAGFLQKPYSPEALRQVIGPLADPPPKRSIPSRGWPKPGSNDVDGIDGSCSDRVSLRQPSLRLPQARARAIASPTRRQRYSVCQ
jgi:hypothetical protein